MANMAVSLLLIVKQLANVLHDRLTFMKTV